MCEVAVTVSNTGHTPLLEWPKIVSHEPGLSYSNNDKMETDKIVSSVNASNYCGSIPGHIIGATGSGGGIIPGTYEARHSEYHVDDKSTIEITPYEPVYRAGHGYVGNTIHE